MRNVTNEARFIGNIQGINLDIKGWVRSMEVESDYTYPNNHRKIHHIILVEDDKKELSLENIGKENKSMTVKIKKQPKEITLEELKQTDEFERVVIYIDEEQKEEVEKKYGVNFNYSDKISMSDTEIHFKKNYMNIQKDFDDTNVPYDFITKIEVVEK